jgi:hypothetical protein
MTAPEGSLMRHLAAEYPTYTAKKPGEAKVTSG